MIVTRILAGLFLLGVGFWATAVQSPPDPGGWSIGALCAIVAGAAIAGHACLDLLDGES
jgi:hypothetical protein